jgi:hypothetical protein
MLNSLNEKDQAKIKKSVSWLTEAAAAADAPAPKVKAAAKTPQEKLDAEKEKLAKLEKKIEGGKSKKPDADAENKVKIEAKIAKMEAELSPPAAAPAKAAAPPAPAPKSAAAPAVKAAVEKKNLNKLTAPMKTQLKTAFETAGVKWEDSFNDAFLTYLNDKPSGEYKLKQFEAHASFYANEQLPIETLSVSDLHDQNDDLTELSVGVYQNKSGQRLTGPEELDGEDFDDPTEIDGTEYIVGQTTQRVYISESEEFAGYWSVQKFYEASL